MKLNKEIINLSKKNLNIFDIFKLRKLLLKLSYDDYKLVKLFLDNYYDLQSLPEELYKSFIYCIHSDRYNKLFIVLLHRNIYDLINFLKNENIKINDINDLITPDEYYKLSIKQIKFIFNHLKNIDLKNDEILLKKILLNKPEWLIKKTNVNTEEEMLKIAIKMYVSIGLDNSIDILNGKYGVIDYEIIYYLFNNLNIKNIKTEDNILFNDFLFSNKKDYNNTVKLMLDGSFLELFIHFDYFYNNLSYYIKQLGTKFNRSKVASLLKEKYLAPVLEMPEINGNILDDMEASYYHKYGITDNKNEIINKNMNVYSQLKLKNSSSIMQIDIPKLDDFYFELLALDDVRNLVMGYYAGNCFRINGDAFALFHNFLKNPHMRILSISTDKYKDLGMVLLMRNGNVLIAQGIEISKRVSNEIDSEKLYKNVKMAIKYIMDTINNEDDEIVVSIIGLTNNNTIPYNQNILPFIINPILDNNNFYNGIYNYQGLLDLKEEKTLKDIKLFTPTKFYFDKSKIYKRNEFNSPNSIEYREMEKILISLRFDKFKKSTKEEVVQYYKELAEKQEIYTICTLKWFIMVFKDGYVDSYINSFDPKIIEEYNLELEKVKNNLNNYNKI